MLSGFIKQIHSRSVAFRTLSPHIQFVARVMHVVVEH